MKVPKKDADERPLIEAAQRDPRRFGPLYEQNFHSVYSYIARRAASREEAEDLTSEVFHRALAEIKKFEWRGAPFGAWLIRIAANALNDRWKRAGRETGTPLAEPEDDSMKDVEQRAALHQLVEGLPPDQRQVVVMRFVEQKSIREIAQQLKRTEGAVKQLQFRALQNLRDRMEGAHA